MSEIQRFDIRGEQWGIAKRTDGLGAFCWAEQVKNYKQSYHTALAWNIVVSLACAIFAAGLVFHKHDPQPVQTVSEEEYQQVVQEERRAQAEKATLRKQLADEHARRLLTDKMLQTSNANNAKLVRQLKEVQASVPTLPIIESSLRKEAATDVGFKAAVARNFGREIAGRVEVR